MKYKTRYIHKISPSAKDVGPEIVLTDADLKDRKTLGKRLRKEGILARGGKVDSFRASHGSVAVFPSVPGTSTYWHAIVFETPRSKRFEAHTKRRWRSEHRYRTFLLKHGEKSWIHGESYDALRARAMKHTKTRRRR